MTMERLVCALEQHVLMSRIEKQINKQTEYAVEKADVVFFLLDGKVGVTAEDRAIAAFGFPFVMMYRWLRSKRNIKQFPIFAVVNKVRMAFDPNE